MTAPAGGPMAGRSLGPWRLRPERQDAEERVWTVSLELGDGAPEAAVGTLATIAWRRPSRQWVLECLPPLHGLRASWAGPGDWPPTVPLRIWRTAVHEMGAAAVACLRVSMPAPRSGGASA